MVKVRTGKKDKWVAARLPRDRYELVKKLCEVRGEEISDFIRRAIYRELARMGLLPAEEARLLEIPS
ncbi:MAG: hypothetical protein DRJ69_04960 [Thermoprotei archaeon]|nr:MAG: hypothetical protein DRJ69_04960 [Thermoprotei archaeon]